MSKRSLKSIWNLLIMGGSHETLSIEARRLIIFLNLITIVGVAILAIFGITSLRQNNLPLALFDLSTGAFLLLVLVFLRISRKDIIASYLCVTAVTLLYFY